MRVKIGELGIRDIYTYYVANTANPLEYKVFKDVFESYIDEITELILAGENFKVPSKLGYFRIRKYKTDLNKLAKDYKKSKEMGFNVYHLNEHSDGFRIKFLWEKKRAILKENTKRPYSFTLARDVKRDKLAAIMKSPGGHKRYPEEVLNQKYQPI